MDLPVADEVQALSRHAAYATGVTTRARFPWILAAAIDAVLVIVFAAIGMMNHDGGLTAAGLARVAWPFLAGAAIGWLVALAWRRPAAPLRTGAVVWILAVGAGMLLRVATGGGFAVSFLIVAALVLGVFLVGWRAVAALVARLRRS